MFTYLKLTAILISICNLLMTLSAAQTPTAVASVKAQPAAQAALQEPSVYLV
jgi:hypothetical protein